MAESSAPELVVYYPIHILRSDGGNYGDLIDDRFTALSPTDPNDIDKVESWEITLAHHLNAQLNCSNKNDRSKQYKLASLPKGYEIRYTLRGGGAKDYYLYGHPSSPRAAYRSPAEFAPHLMWLASTSNDYSHCWCRFCPGWLAEGKAPQTLPTTAVGTNALETALPTPTLPAGAGPGVKTVSTASPAPAQPSPSTQPTQPAPGTTGVANVFRIGEMVWYKHSAWRLGLILAITPKEGNTPQQGDGGYTFTLAPLGHTILSHPPVTKESADMRPFLSFSVPGITMTELQDKEFDIVDWSTLVIRIGQEPDHQKRTLHMQMLGLEASKMAARTINDSHSFFNKLSELVTPDGKIKIQSYTGLYLGAEMVRVSDPIRVSPPADPGGAEAARETPAIMLISEIQHVTTAWPMNDPASSQSSTPSLRFKGNVFRKVRARLPHPQTIVPAAVLGPAFQQEIEAHNSIEKDKSVAWGWMLIERDAVRTEAEVQGRFYVTNRLMTIMDPERFRAALERGEVEDAHAYLNNRSHSGRNGRSIGLKEGRAATVGNAVSTQFIAPEGMMED